MIAAKAIVPPAPNTHAHLRSKSANASLDDLIGDFIDQPIIETFLGDL
jgi:hypothetical protein